MSMKGSAKTTKPNRETFRRWVVRAIWCFGGITLAGLLFGGILLFQISKLSGWESLSALGGRQTQTYSQTQTDKFITSVLITVQNQPMDQEGAQADMVFIASFNAFEQRMTMAALSNDIMVSIEGTGQQTLGEAYASGGPALLLDAIAQQFNLDLQYYACTSTHSLAAMIDLLGGIQAVLTPDEAAYITEALGDSTQALQPGPALLSGIQSMVHAMDNRSNSQPLGSLTRSLALVHSAVFNLRETATKEAMLPLLSLVFSSIHTNLDLSTLRDLGYEILQAKEIEYRNVILPDTDNRKVVFEESEDLSIDVLGDEKKLREALYSVQ